MSDKQVCHNVSSFGSKKSMRSTSASSAVTKTFAKAVMHTSQIVTYVVLGKGAGYKRRQRCVAGL